MPLAVLAGIVAVLVMVLIFLAAIVLVCEYVDVDWINKKRKSRNPFPENMCPSCGWAWESKNQGEQK